MKKYYTPHIDEFCHGFEYIKSAEDNLMFPTKYDVEKCEELVFDISSVLVKYLDADDIISLGFDLIGESKETKIFRKIINEKYLPCICEIQLSYEGDYPIISIIKDKDFIVIGMNCQNKSELKWILTRLAIA